MVTGAKDGHQEMCVKCTDVLLKDSKSWRCNAEHSGSGYQYCITFLRAANSPDFKYAHHKIQMIII